MTQDEWIDLGVEQGWCSQPVCATHDGVPNTFDEDAEWDEGGDPCQHVVRLWNDEHRAALGVPHA